MVFSNLLFVFAFLPLNLLCYFLARDIKTKNTVMLVFSLIFYAWGEPLYILLLLFMAFADWFLAVKMAESEGIFKRKRMFLIAILAVDLGLLAVFKYTSFFLSILNLITGFPQKIPEIALPIGISFYTFQLKVTVLMYIGVRCPHKKALKCCFVCKYVPSVYCRTDCKV